MVPQFPSLICEKAVAKNHKAVCCDMCNKRLHIRCNNINTYTYKKLQKSDAPWYCKECLKKLTPFSNVTNNTLKVTSATKQQLLKTCHLSHRLRIFYFVEKLCFVLKIFKFLYF